MKKDNKYNEIELRSDEYQEVLENVPSWILRYGILLIGGIFIILLIGSIIFKYPETLSTTITLTGTNPSVRLVAKKTGKLQEFRTKNGQIVNTGEYLCIIENAAETNDILYLRKYLSTFNPNYTDLYLPIKSLKLGEIQALYSSFYSTLLNYVEFKKIRYYEKKIEVYKEKIKEYDGYYKNLVVEKQIKKEQLLLSKNQIDRDANLYSKKVLSTEDLEISKDKYLQSTISYVNMESNIKNLSIQTTQIKDDILNAESELRESQNKFITELKTLSDQLIYEIKNWELNYVLKAPIKGKVIFSNYWTINQNVIEGEYIITISPLDEGSLFGKALLPTERSGMVEKGQRVNIKFTNFPENKFGKIRGIVRNISTIPYDKENKYYIVEIGLPNGLKTSYNKSLPYLPEMQGQADIITNDQTLFERLFLPIKRAWKENVVQ